MVCRQSGRICLQEANESAESPLRYAGISDSRAAVMFLEPSRYFD